MPIPTVFDLTTQISLLSGPQALRTAIVGFKIKMKFRELVSSIKLLVSTYFVSSCLASKLNKSVQGLLDQSICSWLVAAIVFLND